MTEDESLPRFRDVIESEGDRVLYQDPRLCDHPREWCKARVSLLDQTYYHCYKCNTDIDKELIGTSPWNRAEKMTGSIDPDCWLDTWDDPVDGRLESFDELYTWEENDER